ncbi:hypothetical protein ACOSQ2_002804 [Xanthoceras sorbifolium]
MRIFEQGFLVFLYSLESLEPCSTDAAESGTRTYRTREREREALEINMEKRLLIICGKKLKKMLKLFGKKDHCFNFRSDIDPFMAGYIATQYHFSFRPNIYI